MSEVGPVISNKFVEIIPKLSPGIAADPKRHHQLGERSDVMQKNSRVRTSHGYENFSFGRNGWGLNKSLPSNRI